MIRINIKGVLKTQTPRKNKMVTIRIPEDVQEWMRRQQVSPTKIFKESIKKLGGPWK